MIKNIIFVQPVFAPDQMRLERNINSIKSFGQYVRVNGTDGYNVSVVIGGWAKTDELWNKIVEAGKEALGTSFNPIRFDKNYGKAATVNKLVAVANENAIAYEALLTSDSDILFPLETKHMFNRLVVAAIRSEAAKGRIWGLIALNQLGNGCHWKVCYENGFDYAIQAGPDSFKEKVVWPSRPSGIAGGCLFLNRKMWDAVGGYRVMGVYAGDDAYLLVDCAVRGFSYQLMDTVSIVHPPENDEVYAQWKVRVCQRDSMTGPKANIDGIIKETDEFWNSREKK